LHSAQHQVGSLQAQVNALQAATAVHDKLQAQQTLVVTALTGDIDWVRVLGQLAAVMPPNLALTTFTGDRPAPTSGGSPSSAASGAGALSFSVTGTGGLPAVAAWLEGLQRDPDLQGTWVSGISLTSTGGKVTFTSSATLTPQSHSNRAEAVQ
jgi:hypothetical protein